MSQVLETVNYKGFEINIFHDPNPENPRNWGNIATMACYHRKYNLGDKDIPDMEKLQAMLKTGDYIYLPLYLYDHSGITMSAGKFSCSWDSGQVGVLYVAKEQVRKDYGWKKITAKRLAELKGYMQGEVETYDNYLTGQVYSYSVAKIHEEVVGVCCGFYGYDHKKSGLLDAAKEDIDYYIKQSIKSHLAQVKTWIKNKVPLIYRKPLQLMAV